MKKALYLLALLLLLFPPGAFSMSDQLYKECLRQKDFNAADSEMNKNWKRLKSLLNKADFRFVLEDQRKWVKNGREMEIDYIRDEYANLNICSLYAISSFTRADLLAKIADFIQDYPSYSQSDIDRFISNLDYIGTLNEIARKTVSYDSIKQAPAASTEAASKPALNAPVTGYPSENVVEPQKTVTGEPDNREASLGNETAPKAAAANSPLQAASKIHSGKSAHKREAGLMDKAKDVLIDTGIDAGVRWLLKKLGK